METLYDFTLKTINGDELSLNQFKGKKALLVNVASRCGYTPQYADLQFLHEQHGDKIYILGFPANNFGGQEPGTSKEIADFCSKNYGVSFPMFEKISVLGKDIHPLYQWLASTSGHKPNWNFCKYLVNEEGEVEAFFSSGFNPMDPSLLERLK